MRISSVLLRTGCLAAHRRHCLMLLGSPPDMVHSCRSRKTHSSSQPKTTLTTQVLPSFRESTPAVADCRYKAPLVPRLVWSYFTSYLCSGFFGIAGPHLYPRKVGHTMRFYHTICPLYHISSGIARASCGFYFLFKYCSHTPTYCGAHPRWPAGGCIFLSVLPGRVHRS